MTDATDHLPIGEYALLADCHSAALVRRDGSVDWACLRRFDAGSVFARLLDRRRGGSFAVRAVDAHETSRRYLDGTLVLQTIVRTSDGTARVVEAFAMRPGGMREQLDVYGHILDAAHLWHDRHDPMDPDEWAFLAQLVDAAADVWRQADQGIWEMRGAPQPGFVDPHDHRMTATVAAIKERMAVPPDGFLRRYTTTGDDGLSGDEGTFLLCSLWLVDALALQGSVDEAEQLYERLLAVGNDLGLFAEEYDAASDELLGNFPQAFTRLGVIQSAFRLDHARTRRDGRTTSLRQRDR